MDEIEQSKEQYTESFDLRRALSGEMQGDLSLAQELAIDIHSVKSECFLPLKILQNRNVPVSSDLTGPIIILIVFSLSLVLQGKLHFGYIYLISLTSTFLIYLILNLLSSRKTAYTICCNVIGYSMSPIVAFSFLSILLTKISALLRVLVGIMACVWSAYASSKVFCIHVEIPNRILVIGYPLFLAYMCFTMMILF